MVFNRLKTAEFLGLKTLVSLSKDYDVDSLAIRTFGENQREAWIASSNWDSVLLSAVSLSPDKEPSRAKGTVIQDKNVLCMAVAGQNNMLLGTSSGKLWVYDAVHRKPKHCLNMLSDSILCLCVSNRLKGQGYIFAGLANGTLAIYNTEDVLNRPNCEPHYEELGTRAHNPIRAMAMCSSPTLYVACGSTVNILKLEPSIFVEKKMETASEREGLITFMEAYQKLIYLSKRNSSVIEVWHNTRLKHKYSMDMKVILSSHFNFSSSSEARITCMCLQKSVALWVGTASGHVTLMDVSQQQPITVIHRHIGAVRCMGILKTMNYIQQSLAVVTVGVGFVSCPGATRETDKNHGYMAVWSYDLAQQVRASADYQKKRQELIENKSRELKSSHLVD